MRVLHSGARLPGREGTRVSFIRQIQRLCLFHLSYILMSSLCEKLALNKFNANSDSNRPTPPNSARVRSDPREVSMLTNCDVWTSLARALSRKAPQ